MARHSPSTTMAPVAIVAIEEEDTTIVVEASTCQVTTEGASNSQRRGASRVLAWAASRVHQWGACNPMEAFKTEGA